MGVETLFVQKYISANHVIKNKNYYYHFTDNSFRDRLHFYCYQFITVPSVEKITNGQFFILH